MSLVRRAYFTCGALVSILLTAAVPQVSAQSLVEMYQSARFRVQAEQLLQINGRRVAPLPTDRLPYVSDSVRKQMVAIFPPPAPDPDPTPRPAIKVTKRKLTPKLAAGWFEETFKDTRWSYLGSNELQATDTTYTRELRARLEAQFGSPTRTIAERPVEGEGSNEYIQFQYWFVLNDSIPLVVMDVNGPFERGVVVATDQRYRSLLPHLKQAVLGPVVESSERDPYVDYYYLKEQDMWFLTGFDGDRYVLERIARPDLKIGRPLLNTILNR